MLLGCKTEQLSAIALANLILCISSVNEAGAPSDHVKNIHVTVN